MTIFASERPKRSTASALVGDSFIRPAAASSIQSIFKIFLAMLCGAFLVMGPAHGEPDEADENPAATRMVASPVILASGTYRGIWRDEYGESGEKILEFTIDGQSIKGKLIVYGVEDYSGDKIRGKSVENEQGTLSLEFKTRDGKWKSKAAFDGQLLIGTYNYEFQDRRVQKIVRGEWAAQRVPD